MASKIFNMVNNKDELKQLFDVVCNTDDERKYNYIIDKHDSIIREKENNYNISNTERNIIISGVKKTITY